MLRLSFHQCVLLLIIDTKHTNLVGFMIQAGKILISWKYSQRFGEIAAHRRHTEKLQHTSLRIPPKYHDIIRSGIGTEQIIPVSGKLNYLCTAAIALLNFRRHLLDTFKIRPFLFCFRIAVHINTVFQLI